jgi:hypothetical protein
VCGVHPGCVDHDACYDDCVLQWGTQWPCTSVFGNVILCAPNPFSFNCHRVCDVEALLKNPINAPQWAIGRGTFSHFEAFEYDLGARPFPECPAGECAPPGTPRPSSKDDPPGEEECP